MPTPPHRSDMRHRITTTDGTVSTIYSDGDPDRISITLKYLIKAYDGEPLFCIRGRDRLAIPCATYYLHLASFSDVDPKVAPAVAEDMDAFAEWQRSNSHLLKYPDR